MGEKTPVRFSNKTGGAYSEMKDVVRSEVAKMNSLPERPKCPKCKHEQYNGVCLTPIGEGCDCDCAQQLSKGEQPPERIWIHEQTTNERMGAVIAVSFTPSVGGVEYVRADTVEQLVEKIAAVPHTTLQSLPSSLEGKSE